LPWSMWAIMLKLRMFFMSLSRRLRRVRCAQFYIL
jgi:hypothetical protein